MELLEYVAKLVKLKYSLCPFIAQCTRKNDYIAENELYKFQRKFEIKFVEKFVLMLVLMK